MNGKSKNAAAKEPKKSGRPSSYTQEIGTVDIYGLYDPRDGELRYVGKANDAKKRLVSHIRDSRHRKTPVYCWIRKLQSMNLAPEMRVIEAVAADRWEDAERRLISANSSAKLLNVAEGGGQPHCPLATRQQNGRKNAESLHSDPERKSKWALMRETARHVQKVLRPSQAHKYSLSHKRKCILNCMALASLFPQFVPPKWHDLRWDSDTLGELTADVVEQHMSKKIHARLEISGYE